MKIQQTPKYSSKVVVSTCHTYKLKVHCNTKIITCRHCVSPAMFSSNDINVNINSIKWMGSLI